MRGAPREMIARIQPQRSGARETVPKQQGPRRIAAPVDPVRIARDGGDFRPAVQRNRQREQIVQVPPAPPLAAHRDRGLAAGQDRYRRGVHQAGVIQRKRLGLSLDSIAQVDDTIPGVPGQPRRRGQRIGAGSQHLHLGVRHDPRP